MRKGFIAHLRHVVETETDAYASELADAASIVDGHPRSIDVSLIDDGVVVRVSYAAELTPTETGPLADNIRDALSEEGFSPAAVEVVIRHR